MYSFVKLCPNVWTDGLGGIQATSGSLDISDIPEMLLVHVFYSCSGLLRMGQRVYYLVTLCLIASGVLASVQATSGPVKVWCVLAR